MKTKRVVHIEVEYGELENEINKYYGLSQVKNDNGICDGFSIVADQEWDNDESHKITVEPKEPKYDWEKQTLQEFKDHKYPMGSLRVVLNDMCLNGVIEAGEYLITVSW